LAQWNRAGVAELADARDLKSRGGYPPCGFDPRSRQKSLTNRDVRDVNWHLDR
jgi:hypothetical protein